LSKKSAGLVDALKTPYSDLGYNKRSNQKKKRKKRKRKGFMIVDYRGRSDVFIFDQESKWPP
jgi:hypothetical protein